MKLQLWSWVLLTACGSAAASDTTPTPDSHPPVTADSHPPVTAPQHETPTDPGDSLVAELNLDFEKANDGKPADWYTNGSGYEIDLDDTDPYNGDSSLRIAFTAAHGQFGQAAAKLPSEVLERARGKQVKLTGWVRTENNTYGFAALWLRVDGPKGPLRFDNMEGRGITGTKAWTACQILLPVSQDAVNVAFGALLIGDGTAWIDGLRVEILE